MCTDEDFALERLMAKATDFQGRKEVDEANHGGKAMWCEDGGQAFWSGGARKKPRHNDGELRTVGRKVFMSFALA
jgi:hypothetical protein